MSFESATPVIGINADTYTSSTTGITYITSASTSYISFPYQAFDDNTSTSWKSVESTYDKDGNYSGSVLTSITGVGNVTGEYLQIELSMPFVLKYYLIQRNGEFEGENVMPKVFYIVGSNNGTSWASLEYKSDTAITGPTFHINGINNNSTPYRYYRLVINKIYTNFTTFTSISLWRLIADPFTSGYFINLNATGMVYPIGGIMPWPSATIPAGWALCDGSAFTDTMYPILFVLLGGSNNFPNLKAAFLSQTGTNGIYTGPPLRTLQGDSFKSHTHNVIDNGHRHNYFTAPSGAVNENSSSASAAGADTYTQTGTSLINITIDSTTGTETAPYCYGINWIIKLG